MKIQLTTPSRGSLDHDFLKSCDELIALARTPGADFRMGICRAYGGSLLDHARSRMATDFLATDSDLLVWVDDDMVFEAESLIDMCREAMIRKSIVGAAASTKKKLGQCTVRFEPHVKKIAFGRNGQLYPVESIGCGLTAVHRSVFEALSKEPSMLGVVDGAGVPVFPFYANIIDDIGRWWGEDTSFCLRAKKIGFSTYCDTRVRVGHKGGYVYHIEDTCKSVELFPNINLELS